MMQKKPENREGGTPRRVTQADIARIAGVHKMTVSDALKGTGRVDASTRERIKRIAEELNYVPNPAARALATGQTGNIVLISGPIYELYYARMVHHLEKHINAAGYQLVLMRTRDKVKNLVNFNSSLSADGVIAIDAVSLLSEFRAQPAIPCVSIGTVRHDFVDNVLADIGESLNYAIYLMREAGRSRIAYVIMNAVMSDESEIRARTYFSSLRQAHLTPEIIDIDSSDPAIADIRLEQYIRENGCPEGLVCQNDNLAICALGVVKRLGYKIPEDVMLVGCDGQINMKNFDPPISTVVQPMEQMCAVAWQMLERRMADISAPRQQVSIRGSLSLTSSLVSKAG